MRVLVLGGTAFLGRHLVEVALERGHAVTLFTRGRTNPALFPDVERIRGERGSDIARLAGRSFDVVLDTSGYLPRVVAQSAGLLAAQAERYVFVSTLSVYEDTPRLDETTSTRRAVEPAGEDITAEYGALKALCEQAVEAAFPGRSLVIRPGLLVGRYDYTGRFGYWPRRIDQGGEVLAPGRPETRVWLLDARDLAEWAITLAQSGTIGLYNAAGPDVALSMGTLLETCRQVTGSDASLTWVSDEFLLERGVVPYSDLPLWVPELDGGYPFIDVSKAINGGLTFRPIAETIRDVLEGDSGFDPKTVGSFGWARPPAGLPTGRERALLAEWHHSDPA
jgi:2'-hydroxyisoflavone reductase